MVNNCFLPNLPSEETIRKWNESKDYLPGVHEKALTYLSNLIKQELKKQKQLVFNLVFDEVHLKSQSYYNTKTHRWEGCVELGGDLHRKNDETKDDPLASKALVFMVVAINGSFKVPVAYYLCDSLTANEKSLLVRNLLYKFSTFEIKIVSMTCDGDKTNVTACELLGANFDYFKDKKNFKPYFENPYTKKRIYVLFDACHMIKLVRNYFSAREVFFNSKDKQIKWSYIIDLHMKQENEGLHCACKIKRRHVFFHREKMKVFLATQLLSFSTAKALEFLDKKLNDPTFQNSSATSEFLLNMNNIFDMLNSKNKFCKRKGKQPITRENLNEMEKKVEGFITYIENLEVDVLVERKRKKNAENIDPNSNKTFVRKNVLNNQHTKTGFLGLIICLRNYLSLSKDLFERKIADYVLSYKLSQDHLEMFFALIRRMGGFCNNPTPMRFKSGYKKLLINNTCVIVPLSANCTPQDNTLLLTDGSKLEDLQNPMFGCSKKYFYVNKKYRKNKQRAKKKKRTVPKVMSLVPNINELLGNDFKDYSSFEHNYFSKTNDDWCASEYSIETVKHITGSVYHVLKRRIHCQACLDLIDGSNNNEKSQLTMLKNEGGLKFASPEVEYICATVEKVIRRCKNVLRKDNIVPKIITETLKILPKNILDDNVHIFDFEPLYDHRHSLILFICQTYLDCRCKYEGEKKDDAIARLRMHNNKMTIFHESNAAKN